MPRTIPVIAACLYFLCTAAAAEGEMAPGQIGRLFASLASDDEPGLAVLVRHKSRVVFERGFGVADLRTRDRIDAQTNFRLASVTKQFTAMAVMLLVHDGKLTYETRLADILPGLPEYMRPVSIRNLLNHTAGLPDYEELMPKSAAQVGPAEVPQIQDAEVIELLMRQKIPKFQPGRRWDYSNSAYVVLGEIVRKVSGRPFGEFLRDRIFAPLKMDRTIAYQKDRNQVPHRAFGYSRREGKWVQTDQSPTSATLGDGGVYSSLTDLAKWDQALTDYSLLGKVEIQAALTPVRVPGGPAVEPDGSPAEYGFGWFLNPYRGHARMWHYGETIGFRTAIQRFPDDRLTVIILCNRSDLNPTALALEVAGLYGMK